MRWVVTNIIGGVVLKGAGCELVESPGLCGRHKFPPLINGLNTDSQPLCDFSLSPKMSYDSFSAHRPILKHAFV